MIRIKFLGDASDLDSVASPAQAQTYRAVKSALQEQPRVKLRDILKGLGLKDPRPFYSRLNHLQEKGFIEWGKPQTA